MAKGKVSVKIKSAAELCTSPGLHIPWVLKILFYDVDFSVTLLSGAGFDFYSDFSVVWQSEKFGIVVQHFISVLVSSLLCTASNIFKV